MKECIKCLGETKLKDRSLFMAWGVEDFRGDHLISRRTKGGSVVTEHPKGGIAKNFGRI